MKDAPEKIREAEQELAKLEQEYGPDHVFVAEALEVFASVLRRARVRTLDAAEAAARAQVIRRKAVQSGAAFDASVPGEGTAKSFDGVAASVEAAFGSAEDFVPESFWEGEIVVEFPETTYPPNHYMPDSDLHDLEVLAYAYENADRFARGSMTDEDALRVWGWIIKQRTGRYPGTLELVDKKAKRLRRRELGVSDNTLDFRVTPRAQQPREQPGNAFPHIGQQMDQLQDAAKTISDGVQETAKSVHETAKSMQETAKTIGDGMQEAAQGIQGIAENVQIMAGIAQKDLKRWIKQFKKK